MGSNTSKVRAGVGAEKNKCPNPDARTNGGDGVRSGGGGYGGDGGYGGSGYGGDGRKYGSVSGDRRGGWIARGRRRWRSPGVVAAGRDEFRGTRKTTRGF